MRWLEFWWNGKPLLFAHSWCLLWSKCKTSHKFQLCFWIFLYPLLVNQESMSMFFEETTVWTVRMFYSTKLWWRNPSLQQSNSKSHFFYISNHLKKTHKIVIMPKGHNAWTTKLSQLIIHTVFPHIVATATVLFEFIKAWKFYKVFSDVMKTWIVSSLGEETIQGRKIIWGNTVVRTSAHYWCRSCLRLIIWFGGTRKLFLISENQSLP